MEKLLVLTVLTGLAVVLTGCGGGDAKKPNTNPAQLVSQTVTGDMSATVKIANMPVEFSGQMVMYLDAENLNTRLDLTVTKATNVTGAIKISALINAANKTATGYAAGDKPIVPGWPAKACRVEELKTMPGVETLRALLKGQLENRKPNGMDGDYRQWVFDATEAGSTVHEVIDMDDQNGLRKVAMHVNSKAEDMTFTFTATNVQMQQPEASVFEVPKDWQPCTPMPNMTTAPHQPLAGLQRVTSLFLSWQPQEEQVQAGNVMVI